MYTKIVSYILFTVVFCNFINAAYGPSDLEERVNTFLYQGWEDGVPYSGAIALGPEAVDMLLQKLADPNEVESHVMVIMALGFLGEPRAVAPLIKYLERTYSGAVDHAAFRALLTVPTALGLIAGRCTSKDSSAFKYLVDGISTTKWDEKLHWSYRSYVGSQLAVLLVRQCISGLGFSGLAEARSILGNAKSKRGMEKYSDVIEEAMSNAGNIRQRGREKFLYECNQ